MADSTSFQDLHRELEQAQNFLHSFTQGYRGFTPEDGRAGVQRLTDLCTRMEERFPVQALGPILAAARTQIGEAEVRLTRLRG